MTVKIRWVLSLVERLYHRELQVEQLFRER